MVHPETMKTTLIATALGLVLTATATHAACPQLTGTYDCVGQSGKGIHVELLNLDKMTYQLEDQLIIHASELGVETVKKGKDFKMVTTAICRDQGLDVETEVSNPIDGQFLSFTQRTYLPQPDGNINVLFTWNDSESSESTLIRCQKKETLTGP